jgi:hypothetical protein
MWLLNSDTEHWAVLLLESLHCAAFLMDCIGVTSLDGYNWV